MRRLLSSLMVVGALVGACTQLTPGQPRKPVTPKSSVKPSTRPVVSASVKPGSPKPSATPMGPTSAFKGHVEIDAYYIVANNAGSVIANGGSSMISLKAGTLISDNGLGLLANNGGSIISDNGLGLISDNGLGMISNGSAGFRILAASEIKLGTVLPVKGMAVFPISMRTGHVIGKPVFTDAEGNYELAVPDSLKGNMRVIARVPVAKEDDPIARDVRLQYNLVSAKSATATVIDEDTSIATRYLRATFNQRLKEMLVAVDADKVAEEFVRGEGLPPSMKIFLAKTVLEIATASKEAGLPTRSASDVDAMARRLTDIILSYINVETIEIDPAKYGKVGPKEPAIPALVDVVRQMRAGATAKMQGDPDYFNQQDWVKAANWTRAIEKPSDACDFVVDNYMLSINGRLSATTVALGYLNVPVDQALRTNAVAVGILNVVGQTLLTDPQAKAEMLNAIKASKQ